MSEAEPLSHCGIYKITEVKSGRCYVGQSGDIAARWRSHLQSLWAGSHTNPRLQQAFSRSGESGLRFEVLEEGVPVDTLSSRERHWILSLRSHAPEHGFNVTVPTGLPGR